MPRGGRPKAPPCPGCGKALYKHPDKGTRVKKHWPFAWCRNEQCELFGKNLAETKPVRKRAKQKAPPLPPPKPLPVEPEAVKKARARITQLIKGGGDLAPNVIALSLVVLAQELGSHQAANILIDDFKLTDTFGVQKIDLE